MHFAYPKPELLLPFLVTVALTELTPGPNMGYLAMVAARWGRSAGLAAVAGATIGLAAYLAAAVTGLAQAAVSVRWFYLTLHWAGVAYLFWLAVETWRGRADLPAQVGADARLGQPFRCGLVANLLNPKAALFYVVLLPGFTDSARGDLRSQILSLGLIHLAVATGVHAAIVLTASGLTPTVASWGSSSDRLINRAMAVGLALIAAWLAWEFRRG